MAASTSAARATSSHSSASFGQHRLGVPYGKESMTAGGSQATSSSASSLAAAAGGSKRSLEECHGDPSSSPPDGTNERSEGDDGPSLPLLCLSRSWEAAAVRATDRPVEASWDVTSSGARTPSSFTPLRSGMRTQNHPKKHRPSLSSTPLALACRYGAPAETIKAILDADPSLVRRCVPSRGTPLHEAVANETLGSDVVSMLLEADEAFEERNGRSKGVDRKRQRRGEPGGDAEAKSGATEAKASTPAKAAAEPKRATLAQDVDGNTPLHLLIRRAFQSRDDAPAGASEGRSDADEDNVVAMIRAVMRSCPEAAGVPDMGEYEETPLVQAIKASVYADRHTGGGGSEANAGAGGNAGASWMESFAAAAGLGGVLFAEEGDGSSSSSDEEGATPGGPRRIVDCDVWLERRIYVVVKVMLRFYPPAASRVLSGAMGEYTALHSAVFHGRSSDAIGLLLRADAESRRASEEERRARAEAKTASSTSTSASASASCSSSRALAAPPASETGAIPPTLRANLQGELPLHFAAMRGECPRTVALLSKAEPRAALKRDLAGLAPLHWLWIRFVSTMFETFANDIFYPRHRPPPPPEAIIAVVDRATMSGTDPLRGAVGDGTMVKGAHTVVGDPDSKPRAANPVETEERRASLGDDDEFEYDAFCDIGCIRTMRRARNGSKRPPSLSNDDAEDDDTDDFDEEYHTQMRLHDPPVDFMRMRHIPAQFGALEDACVGRALDLLCRSRREYLDRREGRRVAAAAAAGFAERCRGRFLDDPAAWRTGVPFQEEVIVRLFWRKAVSLLRAVATTYMVPDGVGADSSAGGRSSPTSSADAVPPSASKRRCLIDAGEGRAASEGPNGLFRSGEDDRVAHAPRRRTDFLLVHTACRTECCPPAVVRIVASLFPEQLRVRDGLGRLPLHYAARRTWTTLRVPSTGEVIGTSSPLYYSSASAASSASSSFDHDEEGEDGGVEVPEEAHGGGALGNGHHHAHHDARPSRAPPPPPHGDAFAVLNELIASSPVESARTHDDTGRLPLHYAIETFVRASSRPPVGEADRGRRDVLASDSARDGPTPMIDALRALLHLYPDALERRDGVTGLYPFMQAAAVATECRVEETKTDRSRRSPSQISTGLDGSAISRAGGRNRNHDASSASDEIRFSSGEDVPLTIVYVLLREKPTLVRHNGAAQLFS